MSIMSSIGVLKNTTNEDCCWCQCTDVIMSKCIICRWIKSFCLKQAKNILNYEAFEMTEYSEYCVGMTKKAMEILKDEFYCSHISFRLSFHF